VGANAQRNAGAARQDGDSSVALAVTLALLRLGPAAIAATEGLAATAANASSREVRAAAAEALRRMRTPAADSALLRPIGGRLPPGASIAPTLPMPSR
jgi:L-asparaginase II